MRANYGTAHSKTKNNIYHAMAEVFFTAIAFYLSDKRGWKAHRIVEALNYINNVIIDLNGNDVKFRDFKQELKEDVGIVIEKKTNGIRIATEDKK